MLGGKQVLGLPLNFSLWVRMGSMWEGGCLAQAMALERHLGSRISQMGHGGGGRSVRDRQWGVTDRDARRR